ncbi:MAG: S8 family serine peptidase [Deltaproteobacteria bacterium]|nr:S8 family serine peptidase [Deltaproteobacteria bacterium]MBW2499192.1 S8 family serine peptidase [Deltaproteobacteria bacterium]
MAEILAAKREVEAGASDGRDPTPASLESHRASEAGAASRTAPGRTRLAEAHNQPREAEDSLDRASEAEVRAALTHAIESRRRRGPLFVAPGIIDRVASERRVRIVFDIDSQSAARNVGESRLAALLSGSDEGAGWEDLRLFPLLGHAAARTGPQALLNLVETDLVEQIEMDALHHPSLDDSLVQIGADLAHADGSRGDGSVIVFLDTGIDSTHPMLAGRVLDEACFSNTSDCPNGEEEMFGPGAAIPCDFGCDHGTHVAGIAAGADAGDGLVGLAPEASLIAIQIFSDVGGSAAAYSSDILAALQHVLALVPFHAISVVNLSFGGSVYSTEESCNQAVASQRFALELLRQAGVASVAAAGNQSFTNALTSPACLSNVISVGSVSQDGEPSRFSNSAAFLSLLAPGESIETAENGGGTVVGTGTSLSAPHVAGAIALMREAVPDATVGEIENALALSGVPVLDDRNGVTTPRIRVAEAIDLLAATAAGPPSGDPGGGGVPATPAGGGGGGGGGACGLVGVEPLLVLGLLRLARHRRRIA